MVAACARTHACRNNRHADIAQHRKRALQGLSEPAAELQPHEKPSGRRSGCGAQSPPETFTYLHVFSVLSCLASLQGSHTAAKFPACREPRSACPPAGLPRYHLTTVSVALDVTSVPEHPGYQRILRWDTVRGGGGHLRGKLCRRARWWKEGRSSEKKRSSSTSSDAAPRQG